MRGPVRAMQRAGRGGREAVPAGSRRLALHHGLARRRHGHAGRLHISMPPPPPVSRMRGGSQAAPKATARRKLLIQRAGERGLRSRKEGCRVVVGLRHLCGTVGARGGCSYVPCDTLAPAMWIGC